MCAVTRYIFVKYGQGTHTLFSYLEECLLGPDIHDRVIYRANRIAIQEWHNKWRGVKMFITWKISRKTNARLPNTTSPGVLVILNFGVPYIRAKEKMAFTIVIAGYAVIRVHNADQYAVLCTTYTEMVGRRPITRAEVLRLAEYLVRITRARLPAHLRRGLR